MQNSIWKFAALTGVVGIGFLIILQVQRQMHQQTSPTDSEDVLAHFTTNDASAVTPLSETPVGKNALQELDLDVQLGQSEPLPVNVADRTPADNFDRQSGDPSARSPWPTAGSDIAESASASDRATVSDVVPMASGLDFREDIHSAASERPALTQPELPHQPATPKFNPFASDETEPVAQTTPPTDFVPVPPHRTNSMAAVPVSNQELDASFAPATGTPTVSDDPFAFDAVGANTTSEATVQLTGQTADGSPVEQVTEAESTAGTRLLSELPVDDQPKPLPDETPANRPAPVLPLQFDGDGPTAAEALVETKNPPESIRTQSMASADSKVENDRPISVPIAASESAPTTVTVATETDRVAPLPDKSSTADSAELLLKDIGTTQKAESDTAHVTAKPEVNESLETPPAELPEVSNAAPLVAEDKGKAPAAGSLPSRQRELKDAPRGPQKPHLSIEKIAPPNAILGKPMVYSIRIKNQGESVARDVVVEDRVPNGSDLVGTIPQAELNGDRLLWRIDTLEPDQEETISVKVVPQTEGQIGSIATVSFVAEVAAETRITTPKLHFTMSGPERVKPGEPVVLQFKLSNEGTADAKGVVLRNVIPDRLTHPDGNDLEYEVGTLPAGESRTIHLTLTAAEPGSVVNKATMSADDGTSIDAEATVQILGNPLKIEQSGPKQVYVGRTTTFAKTVSNGADTPLHNVTVTESVAEGIDFAEASDGGQFDATQRTIVWEIETLAPHETKTLTSRLVARNAGSHTATIRVTDPVAHDSAQLETDIQAVSFASLVVQTEGLEQPFRPGDKGSVRVKVRNRGPSPATHVKVTVSASGELRIESAEDASKPSDTSGQAQFVPIDRLEAQSEQTFNLELQMLSEGDGRLHIEITADQMSGPLIREEAVPIFNAQ